MGSSLKMLIGQIVENYYVIALWLNLPYKIYNCCLFKPLSLVLMIYPWLVAAQHLKTWEWIGGLKITLKGGRWEERGGGGKGMGKNSWSVAHFLCLGYGLGQIWGENFSLNPPPPTLSTQLALPIASSSINTTSTQSNLLLKWLHWRRWYDNKL